MKKIVIFLICGVLSIFAFSQDYRCDHVDKQYAVIINGGYQNDNIVVTYNLDENANGVFIICDMQGKERAYQRKFARK